MSSIKIELVILKKILLFMDMGISAVNATNKLVVFKIRSYRNKRMYGSVANNMIALLKIVYRK